LLTAVVAGLLYLLSLRFVGTPWLSVTILLFGRALLGGAESFVITGAVIWGLALAGPQNAGRVIAWVGMSMFAALAFGAPVAMWQWPIDKTPHWPLVGLTVGLSLIGIVSWGTISGSMLPLLIKRCGLDPATSSAPFVATLVDVTGLVIYFTVAFVVLRGTLL
jgi:Mg/Co/Ni transporter MgtE